MRQPPAVADAVAEVEINDLYVTNSRLRVRRIDDRRGMFTAVYKLTQKVPGSESSALITNTYLCDAEYETLAGLPGDRIHKIRYSVPPIGIDAFLDALE